MTALSTEFVRPNGKVYRPRKAPRFTEYEDYSSCDLKPLVLGTHDLAIAERIVGDCWDDYGVDKNAPVKAWWRDGMRDGRRTFIDDPERGIPVIYWEDQPW